MPVAQLGDAPPTTTVPSLALCCGVEDPRAAPCGLRCFARWPALPAMPCPIPAACKHCAGWCMAATARAGTTRAASSLPGPCVGGSCGRAVGQAGGPAFGPFLMSSWPRLSLPQYVPCASMPSRLYMTKADTYT